MEQLFSSLSSCFQTKTAKLSVIYDCEDSDMLSFIRKQSISQNHRVITLRPPTGWVPLAPLRQICTSWDKHFPEFEAQELDIPSLWLGSQVLYTRFFQRVSEQLRNCPTLALIDGQSRDHPVWKEFLQAVSQNQIKAPLYFLYTTKEKQVLDFGLQKWHVSNFEKTLLSIPPQNNNALNAPLPKLTKNYLQQLLFFGDKLELSALKKVSRAKHQKRIKELQDRSFLNQALQVDPESLQGAQTGQLPSGKHWRKTAYNSLPQKSLENELRRHWLMFSGKASFLPKKSLSIEGISRTIPALGINRWSQIFSELDNCNIEPSAKLLAYLFLSRISGKDPILPESLGLESPYRELAIMRYNMHYKADRIDIVTHCFQELQQSKHRWAAALAATELVRWHLGSGRVRFAFSLLKPFQQEEHWAIRWQIATLQSDAFFRMERYDLARVKLENAVNELPKPISPVLTGELRLKTARMLDVSGQQEAAEQQRSEARIIFRAAGDGVRLGRFLLETGESKWRRQQFDEARGFVGKALHIFNLYNDGLAAREAQIKLGLLIRKASVDVIHRPQ